MRTIETDLKNRGYKTIVGVDEAGRGPLAGPVLAAAVHILPAHFSTEIRDSKQLSPRKRELAYEEILRTCTVGVGQASVQEIDDLNILQATFLAMKRALDDLDAEVDYCLVDGNLKIPDLIVPQKAIIAGDSLCLSIACASIVAKIERDRIMANYSEIYPQYNFAQNKGYATKEHRTLIRQYGCSPIHRNSFKCVDDG